LGLSIAILKKILYLKSDIISGPHEVKLRTA